MDETGGTSVQPRARGNRSPASMQVVAAIGVLFAALAAAIVIAFLSILSLSHDQAELQDKNVPYAVAIATAALNAKGMANDERGYLISGRREFLREFDQRLLNVRTAFAAAGIAADGRTQRDAVTKAQAGFEDWVWAVRGQFATFQAGKREAATKAALGPGRDLRKSYEASLQEAESVATTALQLRNNPLASAGWVGILLVSLLVVLAMCVGLTLWLMRTLNLASEVDESPEPIDAPLPLSSVSGLRRD
jgi:methyl-accepting chemotaxis protein